MPLPNTLVFTPFDPLTAAELNAMVENIDSLQDGSSGAVIPTAQMQRIYPVGSIYINADASTNPSILFGFGTWVAFGAGRVLVGVDATQAEFDTLGETGGAKTHLLTGAESGVKAHSHAITDPGHQHNLFINIFNTFQAGGGTIVPERQPSFTPQNNWMSSATTGITIQNATASNATNAHNNLQPYITVYMWRRSA